MKVETMDNLLFGAIMMSIPAIFAGSFMAGDAPADWIPMWSEQDGKGYQTAIIHTDNIVSIHPVYDETTLLKRNPNIDYLDVYLADGRKLTVFEDYEEFKKRITKHNR